MKITVKTFATVTDITGFSTSSIEITGGKTVGYVLKYLQGEYPRLKKILDSLLVAVNEEYADHTHELKEGDVLAIFPPVSGG
ncbi:MAG: molybdopterin converting factor subunit 1 [Spirochaetota bacterium]